MKERLTWRDRVLNQALREQRGEIKKAMRTLEETGKASTGGETLEVIDTKQLREWLGIRSTGMKRKNTYKAEREAAAAVSDTYRHWTQRDLIDAERRVNIIRALLEVAPDPAAPSAPKAATASPPDIIPLPNYMLQPGNSHKRLYRQLQAMVEKWENARRTGKTGDYMKAVNAAENCLQFFQEKIERAEKSKKVATEGVRLGRRSETFEKMAHGTLDSLQDFYRDFVQYMEDVALPMLREEHEAAKSGMPKRAALPQAAFAEVDANFSSLLAQAERSLAEIQKSLKSDSERAEYEAALAVAQAKYAENPAPTLEEIIDSLLISRDITAMEAAGLQASLLLKSKKWPTRQDIEKALAGVSSGDAAKVTPATAAALKNALNTIDKRLADLEVQQALKAEAAA